MQGAGLNLALRFSAPASEMAGAVQRLRAAGAEALLHTGQEGDIAAQETKAAVDMLGVDVQHPIDDAGVAHDAGRPKKRSRICPRTPRAARSWASRSAR